MNTTANCWCSLEECSMTLIVKSDFTNLQSTNTYLKTHFIKIIPTDFFACAAHQWTKHLHKTILNALNKNKINKN